MDTAQRCAAIREAVAAAETELEAGRAVARVVIPRPEYDGGCDALRDAAETALAELFFGGDRRRAKDIAWTACDAAWLATRANGSVPSRGTSARAEPLCVARSLTEILADPAATAPPVAVTSRLAYRGRTTLLAAREKLGKSTLARAISAAVSRGRPFLGEATAGRRVLYLALEEHVADVVRGLTDFDVDPDHVFLLDRVGDPFSDLEAQLEPIAPDLVVVDTLAAFVESLGLDPGSSSAWTPVMARLARMARDTDSAILILHHGTKRDGSYRDSTAIGAGVDAVLEMSEDTSDASVRRIRARARFPAGDFAIRLVGEPGGTERPRYEASAGEQSLAARVYVDVEGHPGTSTREIRDRVTGRSADITTALERQLDKGTIENRGTETGHRWYVTDRGSGTASGSRESAAGTRAEPESGTTNGSGSAPPESLDGNHAAAPDLVDELHKTPGLVT